MMKPFVVRTSSPDVESRISSVEKPFP